MKFGQKQTITGQFFEWTGHSLLGGELTRNGDGDICLWRDETTVEIKSSYYTSQYGFRLSVSQIEDYKQRLLFPFNRAIYVLFAYRNNAVPVDGRRQSELAQHQNALDINRFLSETILWATVVDFSIVCRWLEKRAISTKSVPGHLGAETVNIRCGEIDNLVNGGFAEHLAGLELNPAKFGLLSGEAKLLVKPDLFNQYHLTLPLRAVLAQEDIAWFKRHLRKRGVHLRQTQK